MLQRERMMLKKRKEPKAKKSIAETLLRDMQGTAAETLADVCGDGKVRRIAGCYAALGDG
jgi:hypothetical protein